MYKQPLKNKIRCFLFSIFLVALAFSSYNSHADPYDILVQQLNSTGTTWTAQILSPPPNDGMFFMQGGGSLPSWLQLGSGLSVVGGELVCTAPTPSVTWGDVTGKPTVFTPNLHTHVVEDISDATVLGKALLTSTSAGGVRALLGAGTSDFDGSYSSLTGIPTTFSAAPHTHSAGDIISGTLEVNLVPTLPLSKILGLQTELDNKLDKPSGTTAQYLRGDGSLATFPPPAPSPTFTAELSYPTVKPISKGVAYQCSNPLKQCVINITIEAESSTTLVAGGDNEVVVTVGDTNAVSSGVGVNVFEYRNKITAGLAVVVDLKQTIKNTYTVNLPVGGYFAVRQVTGTNATVKATEQVLTYSLL